MTPANTDTDTIAAALDAARAAASKGATDVLVLDVGDILGICGHFVIVSVSNTTLSKAVTDEVERQVDLAHGIRPRSVEGADGRRWVLMDYSDFVVHVFHTEEREHYRIERLYSDAPRLDWQPDEDR